jgi:hypothetical protein
MRHILLMLALAVSASGQQEKASTITTESLGLKKTVYRCESGWKLQTWGRWLQTQDGPVWHGDQYFDEPAAFAEVFFQTDPPDHHPPRCVKDESRQQEKTHIECLVHPNWQSGCDPVHVSDVTGECLDCSQKRSKPTHQPVRLIDGRRAYLSCPDDTRQDCTLSVSKPKPSGHAVSTHTKAGK